MHVYALIGPHFNPGLPFLINMRGKHFKVMPQYLPQPRWSIPHEPAPAPFLPSQYKTKAIKLWAIPFLAFHTKKKRGKRKKKLKAKQRRKLLSGEMEKVSKSFFFVFFYAKYGKLAGCLPFAPLFSLSSAPFNQQKTLFIVENYDIVARLNVGYFPLLVVNVKSVIVMQTIIAMAIKMLRNWPAMSCSVVMRLLQMRKYVY